MNTLRFNLLQKFFWISALSLSALLLFLGGLGVGVELVKYFGILVGIFLVALSRLLSVIVLLLFVIGVGRLLQKVFYESKKFFKKKSFYFSSESVFFIAAFIMFIIMSFYLLIGWDRYLVHLVLPVWLIIFYGFVFAGTFLLAKTKRNSLKKVILGHLK